MVVGWSAGGGGAFPAAVGLTVGPVSAAVVHVNVNRLRWRPAGRRMPVAGALMTRVQLAEDRAQFQHQQRYSCGNEAELVLEIVSRLGAEVFGRCRVLPTL